MNTSKIIKGVVNNGRYTVTAPIVKEDYGLYLQIEGVELPETYQVDFSNSENSGSSATMIGNADGVLIPSQFISTGKDVFAFLYHVGADYGRTVYKFRIPNKLRPDRTNEQPTPEEQSTIDQAISALNEAVAQTAGDVESADQSAQSAQEYAEQAESARDTAQGYANNAQTSATQASTSASQASASATASAQSASDAETARQATTSLVAEAQGYADASAQSASASANSASQAQGYAQSASASAQSASGYASSAQASANTASAKAQDASGYAQTASEKASEASQSATTASNKASEASGYATASQTAQGLAESARDSAIQAKMDAESARDDAESARDEAEQAVASISGALDDKADIITDTASGSIASFPDGADDLPLKSLVVDINPIQDLHGQESPYPAGGGKNKANVSDYSKSFTNVYYVDKAIGVTLEAGVTYTFSCDMNSTVTPFSISAGVGSSGAYRKDILAKQDNDNGRVYITFTPTAEQLTDYTEFYVRIPRFGTRQTGTVSVSKIQLEIGSTATSYAPYENICPISGWTEVDVEQSGVNVLNAHNWTIDSSIAENFAVLSDSSMRIATAAYEEKFNSFDVSRFGEMRLSFHCKTLFIKSGSPSFKLYRDGVAATGVRLNSVGYEQDFSYTIPSATKIIAFGGWAYVGEVELTNIQLELGTAVTDFEAPQIVHITIQLGQTVYGGHLDVLTGILTVYPYYDSYNGETLTGEWISDRDKYVAGTAPTIGAQVVNIGAQGVTVQLEPHEVESLHGVNNIWADSGDTEAVYRADTKLYIAKKIAEAISALS